MHNNYNLIAVDFDPFEGNEIEKIVITNEPQREVWLSCILGGNEASLAYNESVSLELRGKFDEDAFQQALYNLVGHHEGLRSVLSRNGEDLIIYKEIAFEIYRSDSISKLDPNTQQQSLKTFINEEMGKPFDLYDGPLFRFYVHKIDENLYYFTIIIHHLIGDGWSLGIILEDLSLFYNAHLSGQKPELPLAEQISDYAVQQTAFRQSEEYQLTNGFWLEQYKDLVPVLNLPLDFNRPAIRTYKGKRNDYVLDEDLLVHIRKLSAKTGSSLVVTLISVFEVLLYHRTGQTDLVVGLPAAGQLATENLRLVGHCVNLLPLLSKIDPDQSFISYLIKRRSEIYDAYDHQRLTFSELIRKLNLKRDKALIPLVPVVFNVDMGMDEKVKFEGLNHQLISNPRVSQTFEISLNVNGSKNSLVFEWAYNTQLFTSVTIDGMMQEFESLLRTITSTPDILIKNAGGLGTLFPAKSGSKSDFTSNQTITEVFYKQATKFPDYTAIVFGDVKITYEELDVRSNQLANYLISKGVKKESLVPICINRCPEMIIGILGIIKSGAAYVPIDPTYPLERINYILNDLNCDLIVSNAKCSVQLSGDLVLLGDQELISNSATTRPEVQIKSENLLYIIYTSGSTGKPKGVMIEHRSLLNYVTAQTEYFSINERENILQFSNYCFDASAEQIFLALLNGACLVLLQEELLTTIPSFVEHINQKRVSHLHATPGFLETLPVEADFPYLKRIVSAGDICKKDLARKWLKKVDFYNKYGPTECTISVLEYQCNTMEIEGLKTLPIGKAIKNTTVYILDDQLKPVKRGELYVSGIQLSRGYLNRPDLTEKNFIINPFDVSEKLYRTGDLAQWGYDENIEFLGRIDEQVKIRGFRIEIGEIENTLIEFPGICQCAVIAIEDKIIGKQLAAYVVTENVFNKESVKQYLSSKIPEYMVPKLIIAIDRLPLNSNGKVNKKELQNLDLVSEKKEFIPSVTEEHKMLEEIWKVHLGLAEISINDNFFELGGHSLIAVKVMMAIETKTGKRLPLAALFENPTIEALAKMLTTNEEKIKWDSLVPIKKTGSKTPVYMIHGGGLNVLVFNPLGKYMDKEQPVYGMQALGLDGKTEFRYNMEELADRYNAEILNNDPIGPYSLVGYSFGGLLAYEMAKKLLAAGKEIKMLGILDSYSGNKDKNHTLGYKIYKKIIRQFKKVIFFGKMFINNPKETHDYQVLVLKRKIANLINAKPALQEDIPNYLNEIEHAYDKASHNYFMEPIAIKVDLFRVKKRLYFLDDPVYLGWKSYAKNGVDIHNVPGDHKTFLFPPYDKEFAEILQKALDNKN